MIFVSCKQLTSGCQHQHWIIVHLQTPTHCFDEQLHSLQSQSSLTYSASVVVYFTRNPSLCSFIELKHHLFFDFY